MKNILLGVTGSIAAYKAADIANDLNKRGFCVDVVMTKSATRLICPLTFQTLTKNRVYTDLFDEGYPLDVRHIALAKKADLCLIAPATANFIGKLANGIADDMLTTLMTAVRGRPVMICPAMNTDMYENPIVRNNIKTLKKYGFLFVEPKEDTLACGDVGKGALADVGVIVGAVLSCFEKQSY